MQRASWMVVLFSFLVPAAVLADDARTAAAERYSPSPVLESSPTYWLDAGHAPGWRLPAATEFATYSNRTTDVIADLQFREPGAFARVSKVRELSLLTLAEVGKSRLFFGVNFEGLFGIHLGARPRLGDDRCVELARMPYLNNATRGTVAR